MSYLLDSDWAISFLNGRANATELINKIADDGIALSIISWGEIYEGLLSAQSPPQRILQFQQFAMAVDVVTLDIDIAETYAQLRSQLRAQGILLADNDLWIAATALTHNMTLVSRDQHFERIPGLSRYAL